MASLNVASRCRPAVAIAHEKEFYRQNATVLRARTTDNCHIKLTYINVTNDDILQLVSWLILPRRLMPIEYVIKGSSWEKPKRRKKTKQNKRCTKQENIQNVKFPKRIDRKCRVKFTNHWNQSEPICIVEFIRISVLIGRFRTAGRLAYQEIVNARKEQKLVLPIKITPIFHRYAYDFFFQKGKLFHSEIKDHSCMTWHFELIKSNKILN